jgi:hypothetical protein
MPSLISGTRKLIGKPRRLTANAEGASTISLAMALPVVAVFYSFSVFAKLLARFLTGPYD